MTIVARGPLAWASLESTEPRRLWRFVIPGLIALTVLTGLNTRLPYYAQHPGDATPVNPLVGVPAERAVVPQGKILLTTVGLQHRPTALESFFGWLDPDVDLFPEEVLLGGSTPEEFQQVNQQSIDNSKDVAITVGLRRLGFTVEHTGAGAIVESVIDGVPAQTLLRPGDVIVSAGGQPVSLMQDVQAAVAARNPGDLLQLEVLGPDGSARAVAVPLIPCQSDRPCPPGADSLIGLGLRTRDEQFRPPFDVTIESEDIGGPSAGLAFTLTVIDLLSEGELTGGRRVAVTGRMDLDGTVGAIGGVRQKVAAVGEAGVDVFLVPAGNLAEAQTNADDDVSLIPVTDLESALAALVELGGAPIPAGPPR